MPDLFGDTPQTSSEFAPLDSSTANPALEMTPPMGVSRPSPSEPLVAPDTGPALTPNLAPALSADQVSALAQVSAAVSARAAAAAPAPVAVAPSAPAIAPTLTPTPVVADAPASATTPAIDLGAQPPAASNDLLTQTPLPPFNAPHPNELASHKRRPIGLIAIAVLASVAALALAWFWSSANSRADDANREAGAATAERDTATQTLLANEVELQTLRDELATARSELTTLEATAATTGDTDSADSADVTGLEDTVASLETEIDRLRIENTGLIADLEAAAVEPVVEVVEVPEPVVEAAEPEVIDPGVAEAPEPDAPEPAAPEPAPTAESFDATTTPEFARYVGELLSSRNGSSRLAQAQSECFGAAIISQVGLNGLGAGLNNAATSSANNAVVGAMQAAASTCNIDASLIFS